MVFNYQVDDISFSPFKKDLKDYSWGSFRMDAAAGLSVALLTFPQALAYAMLAGLPISCGLFAAIYSAIVASAFGSSRHLVTGPSNAIAILVQSGISEILFTFHRDLAGAERDLVAMQVLTQLVLLVGVLQILAAGCKLGRLTQFVSHSVIAGYILGAAFAMVVNQLFIFLGIPRMPGVYSFYEKGTYLVTHLNYLHWPTALIGVASLLLIILLKRIDKRIPAAVMTCALAGVLVHVLDLSSYSTADSLGENIQQVLLVGDTGERYDIVPSLVFPFFDMGIMNNLLPVAFAVALLSILEATSVAKSVAASSGQRLSVNQEIFGLGMGNLLSAFIGALPISGSPSRSSVNFNSGAQTRFSAILNSLFVALILLIFAYFVQRIPLASLAALLLVTIVNLINPKQLFFCLKATSSDAFVLWTTFLSCVFFSLDIAFYIGVVLSIILYLKKAAIPQLVEYELDESGDLKNLDFSKVHEHRTIRVIKVEGELFFGAADLFQTTLKAIAEDDTSTRVIILQLKNARDIDATVCLALQQLVDYLKGSKRHLVACGLTMEVWEILSDSGLIKQVGKENLFIFDERHPHLHMQKAWHRAKMLAEQPVPISNVAPQMVQQPSLANSYESASD